MQCSAKARVLLAVLRRCDVAWKKQGGIRAFGQLVPRFRRALAASLPCPPCILVSHLRTIPQPPSLLWAGLHQLEVCSPREQAFRPGWACLLQGPPRAEPDAPLVLCSHQEGLWAKPPTPRSGHSISQGEGFLRRSLTSSSVLCRVLEEERLLPTLAPQYTHSFRAHLGRLLTQKGRSPKAGWLGPRTYSPSGIPKLQASLRARWHLNWAGARPPISPQDKIPHVVSSAVSTEPRLSQPGFEAAWQQREGGAWRKPASGLAPCRPNPAGPRAGRGPGPLPIAPGSGRDSAGRAPRSARSEWIRPTSWPRQPAPP